MTRFYVYFNIFCGIKFRLWNCHSGTISMTHQMTPNPTGMPRPACSFPLVKTSSPYSARTSLSKSKMKEISKIWFNCQDTLAIDTSDSMMNHLNFIFISFTVKHEQELLNLWRNFFWTQCTGNFTASLIFTLAVRCLAIARCIVICRLPLNTLDVHTGKFGLDLIWQIETRILLDHIWSDQSFEDRENEVFRKVVTTWSWRQKFEICRIQKNIKVIELRWSREDQKESKENERKAIKKVRKNV